MSRVELNGYSKETRFTSSATLLRAFCSRMLAPAQVPERLASGIDTLSSANEGSDMYVVSDARDLVLDEDDDDVRTVYTAFTERPQHYVDKCHAVGQLAAEKQSVVDKEVAKLRRRLARLKSAALAAATALAVPATNECHRVFRNVTDFGHLHRHNDTLDDIGILLATVMTNNEKRAAAKPHSAKRFDRIERVCKAITARVTPQHTVRDVAVEAARGKYTTVEPMSVATAVADVNICAFLIECKLIVAQRNSQLKRRSHHVNKALSERHR